MNARALLFGLVPFAAVLVVAKRSRSGSALASPAPYMTPIGPPAPQHVVPTPASHASTVPTVSPAATPPSPPPPATMAVSVPLPLGWRRLASVELTPELVDTQNQVMQQGFPVGTFAPFDLNGVHYAVLVEQDGSGLQNVSIAMDTSSPAPATSEGATE